MTEPLRMPDWAVRIKALREHRGWSLRELAARSGVSHGQISKLEAGQVKSPAYFTIEALANVLSVDVVTLMEDHCYE